MRYNSITFYRIFRDGNYPLYCLKRCGNAVNAKINRGATLVDSITKICTNEYYVWFNKQNQIL